MKKLPRNLSQWCLDNPLMFAAIGIVFTVLFYGGLFIGGCLLVKKIFNL